MINSVGAAGFSGVASPMGKGHSAMALDARLAQYEIQLSDWVNCPDCNTPEGKTKIAELTGKIGEVKQMQKTADMARASAAADAAMIDRRAADGTDASHQMSGTQTLQPNGTLGTRLNVFA